MTDGDTRVFSNDPHDGASFARWGILRYRDEKCARAAGLDGERLGEARLREDRDAQSMQSLGTSLPLGPEHRTHERAVGHALAVRKQDLRAAALHLRLMSVGGCEIRE